MKLRNNTKNRNATANEIAKQIIKDKLETIFYYQDNEDYNKNYSEEFKRTPANIRIWVHCRKSNPSAVHGACGLDGKIP